MKNKIEVKIRSRPGKKVPDKAIYDYKFSLVEPLTKPVVKSR